ncbi:pentatricopeptide repeat-containing protein [Tanacetum coccineum]
MGGTSSVMLFVNYLISSYEVTDSTPFVFDLVVQICAKLRMINEALDVCFGLSEHGFRLSVISYNTLLHVVQKSDKNMLVWGIYEHMIVNRMDPNDKSVGIMVNALCKEGKLQSFVDMIDRIDGKRCLPRVIVNTCLVFGMVEEGRVEDGLIKMGEVESAREVYDEMVKRGFEANSFVHTKFIKAYCEGGKFVDGDELFRLNGRESVRRANEMLTVLLDKGFVPDVNTFSYLIAGYGREGDVEGVLKLYYEMEYRKLSPGALVFNWLVISHCQAGRLEESQKYFRTMKARSLVPLDCAYDTLISSLRKDTKAQHCS